MTGLTRLRLVCPRCGRDGRISFSEMDDWGSMKGDRRLYVEDITAGFDIVRGEGDAGALLIVCQADEAVAFRQDAARLRAGSPPTSSRPAGVPGESA